MNGAQTASDPSLAGTDDSKVDRACLAELSSLCERYPIPRGALLLILHRLQERRGHLAPSDLKLAAQITTISPAEVYSVASFYSMFRLQPAARFPIGICRNISCWLCGGQKLLDTAREKLGIDLGEATTDGLFSLESVECLGSCDTAPVIEIHGEYFEHLTPSALGTIVDRIRADKDQSLQALALERRTGARKEP